MPNEKTEEGSVLRSTVPPPRELPKLGEEGALIGVCGMQGSGKTVFLTCVYQTVDLAVPSHGELTFDRKDIGGARYFEDIEAEIRNLGRVRGTRERVPARLLLRIDDHDSSLSGQRLPIDLVDFAGKYFYLFADLGPSLETGDLTDEEKLEAHEIGAMLERCDGLVILVSAELFRQSSGKLGDNPFPRSVAYLIDDCRRNKRPLALVFSQADTNPDLTLEKIESFPRVRRFRKQFTPSLDEALKGVKPFGTVELLSCYELDINGPKLQNAEGTIWRPEASRVFMKVLKAAWPSVCRRLEKRRGAREQVKTLERTAVASLRQHQEKRRQRWSRGLLAAAVLALLLGSGGFFALRFFQLQQAVGLVKATAEQVRAGNTVGSEPLAELHDARQLEQSGSWPFGTRSLSAAFGGLWQSLESASESYLTQPTLDAKHQGEIGNLLVFEPLRDPTRAPWWTPELSRKLEARATFLSHWNGGGNPGLTQDPVARINFLEGQKPVFEQLGDEPFRNLLAETATSQKREHVESLIRDAFGLASNLQDRVDAIRRLLRDDELPADAEYQLLLREHLAKGLVASILELDENPQLRAALEPLLPPGQSFEAKSLRLAGVLRAIDQLTSPSELSLEPFRQRADARGLLVEGALADLFRGLEADERTKIWRAMLAELESGYLFDLSVAVDGITPMPRSLEGLLRRGPLSAQGQINAEALLLDNPFYYNELLVIELKTLLKAL